MNRGKVREEFSRSCGVLNVRSWVQESRFMHRRRVSGFRCRVLPVAFMLSLACVAFAGRADASPLSEAVDHLLTAEDEFRPSDMAPLLCAGYHEISPVGDIDDRAQVLSFYAPENRSAVRLDRKILSDVSINGVPLVTEQLHYTLQDPAHAGRETTLIGTWVGQPEHGRMTICHAQFTIFHPSHK
ncbi:hypothetical protein NJLHNGOC_06545 [Novacetimonas cocois]|uniref:Nuclear transport factor 2 family protein n=2 Tax=Novacetimonas cocois TaxID=1747507 RepID=A0A365YWZ8_9PROT|nr:hypothetical protein NJLHNGOC_06545 [Novacetimonas cocois]